MKPFTDSDLKQLKETIHRHEVCLGDSGKLLALIARLEAAELLCEAAESLVKEIEQDHMDWRVVRIHIDTWRKACGK